MNIIIYLQTLKSAQTTPGLSYAIENQKSDFVMEYGMLPALAYGILPALLFEPIYLFFFFEKNSLTILESWDELKSGLAPILSFNFLF